jgi:hypothetical protein
LGLCWAGAMNDQESRVAMKLSVRSFPANLIGKVHAGERVLSVTAITGEGLTMAARM